MITVPSNLFCAGTAFVLCLGVIWGFWIGVKYSARHLTLLENAIEGGQPRKITTPRLAEQPLTGLSVGHGAAHLAPTAPPPGGSTGEEVP